MDHVDAWTDLAAWLVDETRIWHSATKDELKFGVLLFDICSESAVTWPEDGSLQLRNYCRDMPCRGVPACPAHLG